MLDNVNRENKLLFMVHAEINALSMVKRGEGHLIALTHSPCMSCSQAIIAHGINEVIYLKEYHRCDKYKSIFNEYNIKYKQLEENSCQKIKNVIQYFHESL